MQTPPRNILPFSYRQPPPPARNTLGRSQHWGLAQLPSRTAQNEAEVEGSCSTEQLCSPEGRGPAQITQTHPGFHLGLRFHYQMWITNILKDSLWKRSHFLTSMKESRTRAYLTPVLPGLDRCLAAAGYGHICAQINTRLRCQISLLKQTTSDKRTAENRRFVWRKPKASVVLPDTSPIWNTYLLTTPHRHCKENQPSQRSQKAHTCISKEERFVYSAQM